MSASTSQILSSESTKLFGIAARLASLEQELEENSVEVVEEGGSQLFTTAQKFVTQTASEVLLALQLSPNSNVNDFQLTPFAASDGGAYLLIDYAPTDKRITIRVFPDGLSASVARTGPSGSLTGTVIERPDHANRYLFWLTTAD